MHRTRSRFLASAAAALVAAPAFGSPDVEWTESVDEALEVAVRDSRVVLVALGEVGEGRSRRHLEDVYDDDAAAGALAATLNVPAWTFDPEEKRDLPDFGGIEPGRHVGNLDAIKARWLTPNDEGLVAVPHHLWISPSGEVLLSCPWEIDAGELAWCTDEALRRAGVPDRPELPDDARPPRRLLLGETFRLTNGDERGCGLEPDELESAVRELNKRFLSMGDRALVTQILFTDEEDAADFIRKQLGLWDVGGGGRGGGGGAGGGAGGFGFGGAGALVNLTLGVIGGTSPARFLEVLEDHASSNDAARRSQVAVAYEQLGRPEGARVAKKAFRKEKDEVVRADWARALGACGWNDRSTAKLLVRAADRDRSERVRRSAILGLGHVLPEASAREFLERTVREGEGPEREAALLALALGRSVASRDLVRDVAEGDDDTTRNAARAALSVLDGANLYALEDEVVRVSESELPRARVFFRASPFAWPRGRGGGGGR